MCSASVRLLTSSRPERPALSVLRFFLITNYIYFYSSIEKHNRSNSSTIRLCGASTPLKIFNSKLSDKDEIEYKITHDVIQR